MPSAPTDDGLLPHPDLFRSFPTSIARRLAPTDPRPTAEQAEIFRAYGAAGDPLADAVVAEMRALRPGDGRRQFEAALAEGIDAVPEAGPALRALFAAVETPPVWLDRDLMELGSRTIQRTGLFSAYGALVDVSLMGGYLSSRALKVLVRTGEIDRMAPRRVTETALWWKSVTDPGGLDRYSEGFRDTMRVRLIHAQVRASMSRREDWDFEAWDAPINQRQMAGTQLLFGHIGLLGLRMLGFHFSHRETEAVLHLWRYAGHILGVDPAIVPATETDAWRLLWLLAETEFQPDDDSYALAQALLHALPTLHGVRGNGLASSLASSAIMSLHASFSRLAFGGANGDKLGLSPNPSWTLAVVGIAATVRTGETVRRVIPGGTNTAVSLGQRSREFWQQKIAPATQPDRSFARDKHADGLHPVPSAEPSAAEPATTTAA